MNTSAPSLFFSGSETEEYLGIQSYVLHTLGILNAFFILKRQANNLNLRSLWLSVGQAKSTAEDLTESTFGDLSHSD